MEIRFDQLLLVIMVVLFTLADVVFRRMRRRGGTVHREGQAEEGGILDPEVAYGDEIAHEDVSVLDEDVFAPPPPEIPPEFRVPPRVPHPAAPPPPPVRPGLAASAQPRVAASRRRAGPLGLDAHEARRAIVLMTVLGPCRALESDR